MPLLKFEPSYIHTCTLLRTSTPVCQVLYSPHPLYLQTARKPQYASSTLTLNEKRNVKVRGTERCVEDENTVNGRDNVLEQVPVDRPFSFLRIDWKSGAVTKWMLYHCSFGNFQSFEIGRGLIYATFREFADSIAVFKWMVIVILTNSLLTYLPWLRFFYPDWGFSTWQVFLPRLRFFYPDWGFSTLTQVFLPWLRVFYPDWGFSTLPEFFLPWLRFFYPAWGFSTLTEVFLPWLRFFYPAWGFSTLTEVFLPWLRFFYPDWGFSTLTEGFLPWPRVFRASSSVVRQMPGYN